MPDSLNMRAFERRVRVLSCWRGAAQGLLVGSFVACALVSFARLRGHIFPWPYAVGAGVLTCLLGTILAASRRITKFDLADSVDRRAGLKNRLATTLAIETVPDEISGALADDAAKHLKGLAPARVYPLRFGRLQGAAIGLALIAGIVTLLGNRPIVPSPAERARAADSAEAAASVERVLEPYKDEKPKTVLGKLEKSEVAEMERLARDLRNGDVDREKALQRANKALEDAKKLEAQAAAKTKDNLAKAETAMEALAKADSSDKPFDPTAELTAPLQAEKSDIERQIADLKKQLGGAKGKQAEALQNQISKLQSQLSSLNKQMSDAAQAAAAIQSASAQNKIDQRQIEDALHMDSPPSSGGGGMDPLAEFKALKLRLMAVTQAEIANIKERLKTATGAEAERLRKKLAELEAQLDELKKEVDAYNKVLKAALKAAKAKKAQAQAGPSLPMLHTKFNKPMLSTLAKLKQALNKIESGDDLSKEESDALKKAAVQMDVEAGKAAANNDKERAMTAAVLADAARALADGNASVAIAKACRNGLGGLGGVHDAQLHKGAGGPDFETIKDEHNIGKVNHLDKPAAGRGKTTPTVVDPLKGEGPESYIEIRGPASLGARSAIPYRSVLPSYQRKEEAALTGGQIPRKHQKRVRTYFEALNGR